MAKNHAIIFPFEAETKGGQGSGNFGHSGRPGQVGGSAEGTGGGGANEQAKPETSAQRFKRVLSEANAAVRTTGPTKSDKTTISVRSPHVNNGGNIEQDVVGHSYSGQKASASVTGMSDNTKFIVHSVDMEGRLRKEGVADDYATALDWAIASVSDMMYR